MALAALCVMAACGGKYDHSGDAGGGSAGSAGSSKTRGAGDRDQDEDENVYVGVPAVDDRPAASPEGGAAALLDEPPDEPTTGGRAPVNPQPGAGADGAGGSFEEPPFVNHCFDACKALEACGVEDPFDSCVAACYSSIFVESHDTHCLALRVLWIDEEGCPAILDAYRSFNTADDCSD